MTGVLLPSPEFVKSGDATIATVRNVAPWTGFDVGASAAGAQTDTQPVTEPAIAKTGHVQPMFGFADWYDRIHITANEVDLGNVVGPQTRDFTLWNAYLVPKTLAAVNAFDDDGVTLTQPATPPLVFEGLRERVYTVNVSTDGPAIISTRYVFDFIGANDQSYAIIGARITPWIWLPNWREPMNERLDWLTDTMTAFDGTEQRVRGREFPRRALEFSFAAEGRLRRRLDSTLYGWGARVWALPFWPDGERLTADLVAGGTTIPATTTGRDYTVGGLVMLLAEDGANEVIEIESIAADTLTLVRPLLADWSAGSASVYPARPARLPAQHGIRRFTGDFVVGRARMEFQDASDWPEAVEPQYRARPVMTERPNWTGEVDQQMVRKLAELDFRTGRRVYDDESDRPAIVQAHRWFLEDRAAIAAFRSWLYARAGKYAAVWVPTWSQDILVKSSIAAAATTFDVEHFDYTRQVGADMHRRDIRIELTTGQVFYRRIVASAEVDPDTETLTIDTPLGTSATPEQIALVSFMALARMDTDGVEIAWFTGGTAQAATNMRGVGHDV